MKKFLIPFIALVLALATASCIGNDEPTNSITQVVKMYNRAMGDNIDGCLLSTATTQIAIDMNASTISLSTNARVNTRQKVSFKVELLKMASQSAGLYTFSARTLVVFLEIWPNIECACPLPSPDRLVLISARTE